MTQNSLHIALFGNSECWMIETDGFYNSGREGGSQSFLTTEDWEILGVKKQETKAV